jgi:Ca-activated chloride channel homolog
LEATGGTAIDEALARGLADGKDKGEKPHLVLFVTDGNPTIGETDETKIASHAATVNASQRSRVFTFGVGEDLNARLLDRLAAGGNGVSEFAKDGRAFEVKISSFFDKVSNPVLSDVTVDLNAFGAFDVYPKKIPDLFSGQQLTILGRYRTPKDGAVTVSGQSGSKRQVFEYRADMKAGTTPYAFVPQLWAVRKVGFLLEEIRLRGETPELKNEVTALGKKFGIVTPYTSYLVVEDTPVVAGGVRPPPRPMPRPRPFPVPVPSPGPEPFPGPFPVVPDIDKSITDSQRAEDERMMQQIPTTEGLGGLGLRGPSKGRGAGGAAPTASAPPPAKMNAAEGSEGIAASQAVREMKEATTSAVGGGSKVAAGRTFVLMNSVWTEGEPSASEKLVTVKYLSPAYFALLKAKPELKAAFALGSNVSLVIVKGRRLVISSDKGETAAEKVSEWLK